MLWPLVFGYQVEWPVSLVLNQKALAQYQMIFRHFLYSKLIELHLEHQHLTKILPGIQFKVYHPTFGLRQRMLNLIQNLSYYMFVEGVEPAWNSLVTSIAKCITIDEEVLAKHGDFLDCCLHDYLLSRQHLLATVKKLQNLTDCAEDFIEDMNK
jgi:gamma-tubulin complex component 2